MEYNHNLDILEIKNFLNKRGWNREGLEKYTDLTLRELFNAYIEKSNVISQFSSYVMKLLGINTHNFFEIKDRISGNSRQAKENRAVFLKMVNHIKVNYLNQLKNAEIDDVTRDLIEKATNMFVTLGKKEYISVYMVEKLSTRGLDINFSKAENINNPKLSAEYNLIKNKDELYYDADLYAVDLKKDITNINTSTTKKGFEDKIFVENKNKFISAMGITADNLKPYHKSNSTSDSLANLILNNLGYDKSKQKRKNYRHNDYT